MRKYLVLLAGIIVILLAATTPTYAQSNIYNGSLTFGTSPNTVTLDIYNKCVFDTSDYKVEIFAMIRNNSGGTVDVTFDPVTSTPSYPNSDPTGAFTENNVPNGSTNRFVSRFGAIGTDYTGVSVSFTVSGAVSGTQTLVPSFDAGCTPTAVSLTSTQATGSLPTWAYGIMLTTLAATGLVLLRRK
ncbi:MAG: hypothetical protein Kow0080_37140 [Candidatus Promineifilaceae bacterium]